MNREDEYYETGKISVGIIPGGSSNGFSETIVKESGENRGIEQSWLIALKGQAKDFDLTVYKAEGREEPIYSFLSFFWAIVSDIDLESEKLRCLGNPRFFLWSVLRVFCLRRYSGTLKYNGYTIRNKHQDVDLEKGLDEEEEEKNQEIDHYLRGNNSKCEEIQEDESKNIY